MEINNLTLSIAILEDGVSITTNISEFDDIGGNAALNESVFILYDRGFVERSIYTPLEHNWKSLACIRYSQEGL
jgi:hypothetical protein